MIYLKNPEPNPSFVFQLEEVFTEDDFKTIEEVIDETGLESAGVIKGQDDEDFGHIRKTDIGWLAGSEKTEPIYQKIAQMVRIANDNHFHYSLSYIETLQYGEYKDGGHYDYHTDSPINGKDNDNRKLSFSILLNDPSEYEGGELEIPAPGVGKITVEKNCALFFPSFMPHRVCPVTSGVRKSLVGWVHGPNFV
jgi:PKHD-type hydroxylase